jgi:hypothetical protein
MLWANRDALLDSGVHVLGERQADHYRAGKDARGIPFDPSDPGVDWTGAWETMANDARRSSASTVVVTDEHLAAATTEQATAIAASMRGREVHVVYVTRPLPDLLPSEWQEYVKHGSTQTYESWARAVLAPRPRGPGRWFWSVHDPVSVTERWGAAVGSDRVHVIPFPGKSAPRDMLWRRFAAVLDITPDTAVLPAREANSSLSAVAAEVLRRVNGQLSEDFPPWHQTGVVRDIVANEILNPLGTGRPTLPADLAEAADNRYRQITAQMAEAGHMIVTDSSDTTPIVSREPHSPPTTAEQLEVAVAALAALSEHLARMRDDRRSSEVRMRQLNRRELEQLTMTFEAAHPMATRLDRAKQRVRDAEHTSRLVAAALRSYRAVRHPGAAGTSSDY